MTLSDHLEPIEIRLTNDFQNQFKFLKKRYRKIKADIQSTLDDLESGKTPGNQFSGIDSIVMKVRIKIVMSRKVKAVGIVLSTGLNRLNSLSCWISIQNLTRKL
jgi:hypothetical protein